MIKFQPPIEVELVQSGMPALMLGFSEGNENEENDFAFLVFEDGTLGWRKLKYVKTNWRYDWNEHLWIDTKENDATQDDPLDGGTGFPGAVPEPDELSQSDPLDEEGR